MANLSITHLQRINSTPFHYTMVEALHTEALPENSSFSQTINFFRTQPSFLPNTTPPSSTEQRIEDFVRLNPNTLTAKEFAHALNVWDFVRNCDAISKKRPQTFKHTDKDFYLLTVAKDHLYIHLKDYHYSAWNAFMTIELSSTNITFTNRTFTHLEKYKVSALLPPTDFYSSCNQQ